MAQLILLCESLLRNIKGWTCTPAPVIVKSRERASLYVMCGGGDPVMTRTEKNNNYVVILTLLTFYWAYAHLMIAQRCIKN